MKGDVIYLQASFWKKLRDDTSIAGLGCLLNVYQAISEAELRTDISDEDWNTDPYLILLWKRYLSGLSNIDLYESVEIDTPIEDTEDLCAIYLTDDSETSCYELGNKYGIKVINSIDLPKKEYLFKGDGFSLTRKTQYEDRFAQFKTTISHPCNAAILIDPYILCKPINIENNLPYLLDAILPSKRLSIPFHFTIYSMTDERGITNNIESVFNKVSGLFAAIRKDLKYCLTICAISRKGDFHRRMIITNNILFDAPDGFTVFNESGFADKNAKYDIVYPRLIRDNRQDLSEYYRWIQISYKNLHQNFNTVKGSLENRLFDILT